MGFRMLSVKGPIKVQFNKQRSGHGKRIEKEHQNPFWQRASEPLLEKKQGCYVFALRAGRGSTPWYVGKASKSFQQECFTSDKLQKYNRALFGGKKGSPVLFFVTLPGKKMKISARTIKDVETYLIGVAKETNPNLLNKSKTKTPAWGIKAVYRGGQGKPNQTERAFRKMLGL